MGIELQGAEPSSCSLAVVYLAIICSGNLIPSVIANVIASQDKGYIRTREIEHEDSWMHVSVSQSRRETPHTEKINQLHEDESFWHSDAQLKLQAKISMAELNKNEAKNTILFLGDGMSIPTVTAARIFKGQQEGLAFGGEEGQLHFDSFPHIGLSKTYCVDSQVADSACSATAYLCGVKANIATIGVNSRVLLKDCEASMNPVNRVSSIVAWAQAAGKSTGILTTTRITHASPAGTYAHVADRDWENDHHIKTDGLDPETCEDIAEQLILSEPGSKINVILGGGRQNFFNSTTVDPEGHHGHRTDGKNLVETWLKGRPNAKYVTGADQLEYVNATNTDYLLGLFAPSHIAYNDSQAADNDPSLAEMTQKAIEILSKNPKGYFLFVEGGRIDHAHHDNQAQRALIETIEFDKAIALADKLTSDNNTLIVVTADHAHVMTINGYPHRGNPLLGISDTADDNKPYSTLSYANGPGFRNLIHDKATEKCTRPDLTADDFNNLDYRQPAMIPLSSETHGGDDVAIFAKGPWAHLFSGVHQQNYIPHAMAYAACIGKGAQACDGKLNEIIRDLYFG